MTIDDIVQMVKDLDQANLENFIRNSAEILSFIDENEISVHTLIDYIVNERSLERLETAADNEPQGGGSSVYSDDLGNLIDGLEASDPLLPDPFETITPAPEYSIRGKTFSFEGVSRNPDLHMEEETLIDDEDDVVFPDTPPAPPPPDPDDDPENPPVEEDGKGNKGHGNNHDGQDDDNPGQGSGGPNSNPNDPKDGDDEDEGAKGNQDDDTPGSSMSQGGGMPHFDPIPGDEYHPDVS